MTVISKVYGTCHIGFGDTWAEPTADQHLLLAGGIAYSDYTATPTDLQFDAKIRAADYTPSAAQLIGGKWGSAGAYSWALFLATDGTLSFGFSENGTDTSWDASTAALPSVTDNVTDIWVRVLFDSDDGGGNRVTKFYTSSNGTSWTQLGSTVTTGTTVTIFSSTQRLAVGATYYTGYPDGFAGRIYRAAYYSDLGSTLAANPKFDETPWNAASTAEDDDLSVSWTLASSASIAGSAGYAWTDVTDYLRDFSIRWGRSSEYDRFRAGVCSLRLSNSDRRFEPDYASGAYYPNVKPWVPVKVGVHYEWDSSSRDVCLFSGFVERWRLFYPSMGGDAVAEVTASDSLKIPAQYQVTLSVSSGTPGAMVGEVLDGFGWSTGPNWRALSTGAVSLDGTTGTDVTALSLLNTIVDSDGGWLFSRPEPYVHAPQMVFRDRLYPMGKSPVLYFRESNIAGSIAGYHDILLVTDEERIRNRWRVGIVASTEVAVANSTNSQDSYGLRVRELTGMLLPTTGDADDRALAGVHTSDTPSMCGQVTCSIRPGVDYLTADRIAMSNYAYQPLAWVNVRRGGVDEDMLVDGCAVDYQVDGFPVFTFYLSPASLGGTYWILGDSDLGKLDETAYLGW